MGQYLKGRKIGTCESMYYMRLSEAQERAARGEADDDGIKFSDYLKDNITRFRFPFPDEDPGQPANKGIGHESETYDNYDKSFKIPVPETLDIGHSTICLSNTIDGCDNVNIIIPCVYSKEFRDMNIKHSPISGHYLYVKMEGIRDGQVKTIFECPRCGQQQRFSDDDIVIIKEFATKHFKSYNCKMLTPSHDWIVDEHAQKQVDYALQVIDRIR